MSLLSTNNSRPTTHDSQPPALHRFAIFTSLSTFFLIIAGASVTSTGSGLAVPDWPLSFGQFFPPMVGGVFFEHGHRLIAGTVGILTGILMVWLWLKEERRWLCWLGTAAFVTVLLQAILGGVTVLYGLPQKVSIAHAILAQTFFCLTVALALFTSPYWQSESEWKIVNSKWSTEFSNHHSPFTILSLITTSLIFLQLILGAASRHGAGQIFLNLHIAVAFAVAFLVGVIFFKVWKNFRTQPLLFYPALSLALLTMLQILLGIFAVLPKFGLGSFFLASVFPWIVSIHVGVGALLLGISLLITLVSYRPTLEIRQALENERMSIVRMSKTHDPRPILSSPSLR